MRICSKTVADTFSEPIADKKKVLLENELSNSWAKELFLLK